jgi:hypothetical protein
MQRLKRWESPRRQGRNDKGKGGSARRRQIKKQYQMLRQKLKATSKGREVNLFLWFLFDQKLSYENY